MAIGFRVVKETDASIIYFWKTDALIKQMALDFDYKTSEEEQLKDIKSTLSNEFAEYNIITYNNQPIGYIRIDWMDHHKNNGWLRFALGEKRGNGYAQKALNIYIHKLFSDGCKRIEGEVYEINKASQKVLENTGFKQEGIKRQAHFTGTEFIDVYVYGIIKDDL